MSTPGVRSVITNGYPPRVFWIIIILILFALGAMGFKGALTITRALTVLMVLPAVLLSLALLGLSAYVMIEQGDTSFGTLFAFGSAVCGTAFFGWLLISALRD